MHITTQYLVNEEKVAIANSKVEALKTEASSLRNDLGATMDALNASKEKTKALTEQLESEKQMVKQKDDLLVSAPADENCCCQGRHCFLDHGRV